MLRAKQFKSELQEKSGYSMLKHRLDFLWAITQKEMKANYKYAALGFLWVTVSPLLQMLIIGLIFSYFIKIPNYFLHLYSSLLMWQFFSRTLNEATTSIVRERFFVQSSKFARDLIPLSVVLSNTIHLCFSLFLLVMYLFMNKQLLFPQILLLIPMTVWLIILATGASLLTAALYVRFRDINFLVQSTMVLLFYATPVLYSLNAMPRSWLRFFYVNPLTSIFEGVHISILGLGMVTPQILWFNAVVTILILVLAIIIYRSQHRFFVDWI